MRHAYLMTIKKVNNSDFQPFLPATCKSPATELEALPPINPDETLPPAASYDRLRHRSQGHRKRASSPPASAHSPIVVSLRHSIWRNPRPLNIRPAFRRSRQRASNSSPPSRVRQSEARARREHADLDIHQFCLA